MRKNDITLNIRNKPFHAGTGSEYVLSLENTLFFRYVNELYIQIKITFFTMQFFRRKNTKTKSNEFIDTHRNRRNF